MTCTKRGPHGSEVGDSLQLSPGTSLAWIPLQPTVHLPFGHPSTLFLRCLVPAFCHILSLRFHGSDLLPTGLSVPRGCMLHIRVGVQEDVASGTECGAASFLACRISCEAHAPSVPSVHASEEADMCRSSAHAKRTEILDMRKYERRHALDPTPSVILPPLPEHGACLSAGWVVRLERNWQRSPCPCCSSRVSGPMLRRGWDSPFREQ